MASQNMDVEPDANTGRCSVAHDFEDFDTYSLGFAAGVNWAKFQMPDRLRRWDVTSRRQCSSVAALPSEVTIPHWAIAPECPAEYEDLISTGGVWAKGFLDGARSSLR